MKMRERIILSAIQLFNEHGMTSVRVRDIASDMSVSPGSISYHFRNKEELMLEIYKYMLSSLNMAAIAERLISGGSPMEIARVYAEYVYRFRFFFQDTLEIVRAYPRIGRMHQTQSQTEITTIKSIVYLAVGNGTLIPEPKPGLYAQLCEMAWMTLHFWFARNIILGNVEEGIENALIFTTNLGDPYFTEKGRNDLREFERRLRNYSSVSEVRAEESMILDSEAKS